jgi:hypothetical protein
MLLPKKEDSKYGGSSNNKFACYCTVNNIAHRLLQTLGISSLSWLPAMVNTEVSSCYETKIEGGVREQKKEGNVRDQSKKGSVLVLTMALALALALALAFAFALALALALAPVPILHRGPAAARTRAASGAEMAEGVCVYVCVHVCVCLSVCKGSYQIMAQ